MDAWEAEHYPQPHPHATADTRHEPHAKMMFCLCARREQVCVWCASPVLGAINTPFRKRGRDVEATTGDRRREEDASVYHIRPHPRNVRALLLCVRCMSCRAN